LPTTDDLEDFWISIKDMVFEPSLLQGDPILLYLLGESTGYSLIASSLRVLYFDLLFFLDLSFIYYSGGLF